MSPWRSFLTIIQTYVRNLWYTLLDEPVWVGLCAFGRAGVIDMHRPHPGNVLKPYQVRQLLEALERYVATVVEA